MGVWKLKSSQPREIIGLCYLENLLFKLKSAPAFCWTKTKHLSAVLSFMSSPEIPS